MRVISGNLRGKKLYSLEGLNTRPTLDRVKEALFNILQLDIPNAKVLDLFSGSGALAIEALSRGAKEAVLCDNSKQAINIINKNLEETRQKEKSIVLNCDYTLALKKLGKDGKKFDIIFLDPPYESDFAVKAVEELLELNLLDEDGIIIIETDSNFKKTELEKNIKIKIYNERKYGKVNLIFIRKG